MKFILFGLIIIIIVIGSVFFHYFSFNKNMFKIFSPAFSDGQMIPEKYTCDGENIIPPLVFENIPAKTKSLAIITDDPDSSSRNFLHWIIWNINPDIKEIKEGLTPDGAIEGPNDFKEIGYGGPCPYKGEHRYIFSVYALDATLNLSKGSSRTDLEKEMTGHILGNSRLIGKYRKLQNRDSD